MFFLDKKRVTISLKYLGGHPELPKQRTLTVLRTNDFLYFKEVSRPVIPVSSIKKIILRNADRGPCSEKIPVVSNQAPALFEQKKEKKIKNIIDVWIDYNGLEIHMLFTGDSITTKYAQFMGLLKGSYKEYEHNEHTLL